MSMYDARVWHWSPVWCHCHTIGFSEADELAISVILVYNIWDYQTSAVFCHDWSLFLIMAMSGCIVFFHRALTSIYHSHCMYTCSSCPNWVNRIVLCWTQYVMHVWISFMHMYILFQERMRVCLPSIVQWAVRSSAMGIAKAGPLEVQVSDCVRTWTLPWCTVRLVHLQCLFVIFRLLHRYSTAIECTGHLVTANIEDQKFQASGAVGDDHALRILYAMALVRWERPNDCLLIGFFRFK